MQNVKLVSSPLKFYALYVKVRIGNLKKAQEMEQFIASPLCTDPPETDFPNPYIIIDVEMEEGWRMYSRLIDCDPLSVQIDQSVKVVFREFQGRVLPFFQLREC